MSYLDRLFDKTPAPTPVEEISALLVRQLGHRHGLPKVDRGDGHQRLVQGVAETLSTYPLDRLRELLHWVFRIESTFWADSLREAN